MFINNTDPTFPCVLCSPTNCVSCSSISQCSVCDTANTYVLNSMSDNLCYLCSVTVTDCINCSSYGVCTTCNYANNYYLSSPSNCSLCTGLNMFINLTDPSYPCTLCTLSNCITCTSLIQCGNCNRTIGYYLNTTDYLCYYIPAPPICGDNIKIVS